VQMLFVSWCRQARKAVGCLDITKDTEGAQRRTTTIVSVVWTSAYTTVETVKALPIAVIAWEMKRRR